MALQATGESKSGTGKTLTARIASLKNGEGVESGDNDLDVSSVRGKSVHEAMPLHPRESQTLGRRSYLKSTSCADMLHSELKGTSNNEGNN